MTHGSVQGTLMARSDRVAFLTMPASGGTGNQWRRMQGFTGFGTSKNPMEYSRQYVDEPYEQTDVTGFSPSIGFGFDKYNGNDVHDYLAEIIDNENVGTAAVVEIVVVDFTQEGTGANTYTAWSRPYAVVTSTEGDSMDAFTYSGDLRNKGARTMGQAVVAADGLSLTSWTPDAA